MPSRELQKPSPEGLVAPAWEATPWQAEERVVSELEGADREPPMKLSDEHVFELTESESLRRAT